MDRTLLRSCRPEDLPRIRALIRLCLPAGGAAAGPDFWCWKHERNPFGPSPCLIAEAAGEIVGVRLFLRWRFEAGDREIRAVRAVDTATHPGWRRRGVFSRLTRAGVAELERQGVDLVFNTPNRRSRPGYLRMGWTEVGRVPLLVRAVWRPARSALPGRGEFPAVGELLGDARAVARIAAGPPAGDARLTTARTPDYLSWRYVDAPGLDYRALWTAGDEGGAAVVFRLGSRRRLREVVISETLIGGRGLPLLVSLLRRLAAAVDAHYLVAAAGRGTAERRALRLAGFAPLPVLGRLLTVRPVTAVELAPDPRRASSWRLSLGDLEVF